MEWWWNGIKHGMRMGIAHKHGRTDGDGLVLNIHTKKGDNESHIFIGRLFYVRAACIFNSVCWKRLQQQQQNASIGKKPKTAKSQSLYQHSIEINEAENANAKKRRHKCANARKNHNVVHIEMRINSLNTFELSVFLRARYSANRVVHKGNRANETHIRGRNTEISASASAVIDVFEQKETVNWQLV